MPSLSLWVRIVPKKKTHVFVEKGKQRLPNKRQSLDEK
jgi:hypothetical protein